MNKPKTEYFTTREDGVMLVVTTPTNNCLIRQIETGSLCDKAIDIGYQDEEGNFHPLKYTYASTDMPIPLPPKEPVF